MYIYQKDNCPGYRLPSRGGPDEPAGSDDWPEPGPAIGRFHALKRQRFRRVYQSEACVGRFLARFAVHLDAPRQLRQGIQRFERSYRECFDRPRDIATALKVVAVPGASPSRRHGIPKKFYHQLRRG